MSTLFDVAIQHFKDLKYAFEVFAENKQAMVSWDTLIEMVEARIKYLEELQNDEFKQHAGFSAKPINSRTKRVARAKNERNDP